MSVKVEGAEVSRIEATIGADPELFLIDGKGKFISAVGLIGGTKANPRPIGMGAAVQEDNVAVEFNIMPASQENRFVDHLQHALEYLMNYTADKGYFLSITASKVFDEDQLKKPAARVFGCDPDYNAWTGRVNPRPESPNPSLRSAGGHVHIGFPDIDQLALARWCDITMGLYSVLEDDDKDRRMIYGKAGAFRKKAYGIEYRTLSNYWIKSPDLMRKIFRRANLAVERVNFGWGLDEEKDGKEIQECINTGNKGQAEILINTYGVAD
jgi:hypothetical protein